MFQALIARFADTPLCQGLCTSSGTGLPAVTAGKSQIDIVIQLVFGVIGAVALILIIVGAIQMVTSQGDPQSANRARNTIIYAIVGLVIALSAEIIVTFVLGRI